MHRGLLIAINSLIICNYMYGLHGHVTYEWGLVVTRTKPIPA